MSDQMTPAEGSLQKYYSNARRLMVLFEEAHSAGKPHHETWPLASLWLGLLYVTVEGWQALRLSYPKIDTLLLNAEYLDLLRRFRNGVFHFQPAYWDSRFGDLTEDPASGVWARELMLAFREYFAWRAIETRHPSLQDSGLALRDILPDQGK